MGVAAALAGRMALGPIRRLIIIPTLRSGRMGMASIGEEWVGWSSDWPLPSRQARRTMTGTLAFSFCGSRFRSCSRISFVHEYFFFGFFNTVGHLYLFMSDTVVSFGR